MESREKTFVPALSFEALTPLYDWAIALTMREKAFRTHLIERAGLAPGMRVLDLGCGTGTLAIMMQASAPRLNVIGLDLDPAILAIARTKAARAGAEVEFVEGRIVAPPLAAASVDRIVTTLVLHHLTDDEKERTLAAARRLLRPGGSLHIADFARPHTAYTRLAAALFRPFDGYERTAANLDGRIPAMMRAAGFVAVDEDRPWTTVFGTLGFVSGVAP